MTRFEAKGGEAMQAVILAAVRSTRMGRQKLLMPFGNGAMIDRIAGTVLACGFEKTFVVLSRETLNLWTPPAALNMDMNVVVNPAPDRGQGSSLRCGLQAADTDAPFALFLADKPAIAAPQILELRRLFEDVLATTNKSALVPQRDGAPGHPGFYAPVWRQRFIDAGDGRSALLRYADEVEWTEGYDSCFLDVDTMEDYRRLTVSYIRKVELQ